MTDLELLMDAMLARRADAPAVVAAQADTSAGRALLWGVVTGLLGWAAASTIRFRNPAAAGALAGGSIGVAVWQELL